MMNKNIVKNIVMLYGLSIAKIVLPLITLPYLTRVLSVDTYGTVSYVKTIMTYLQLTVDFGFMLSGTKDIVEGKKEGKDIGKITGDILLARIILGIIAFIVLLGLTIMLPILKENTLYVLLSYVPVFLSIFLLDYLFRGLEEMQVITIRFVVMKGVAAILTFVFVRNDAQIIWIPLLDCLGSVCAVGLVWIEINKRNIQIRLVSVTSSLKKLAESAIYFVSEMATTAFGALNTVLIGAFLAKTDVAYWSLCITMVSAVQSMYEPINSGVYPDMVKNRNFKVIKRTLSIFMPIVAIGCIFTILVAKYALLIVGGEQYVEAASILRALTPVLFISFPAMLFGWPTLGALGRAKEVTITTIITALSQILGLLILIAIGKFDLIEIALLRWMTELLMLICRVGFCVKFRKEFK